MIPFFIFYLKKYELIMRLLNIVPLLFISLNLLSESTIDDSLILNDTRVIVVNDMGFPCSEFEFAKEEILRKYLSASDKKIVLFLDINFTRISSSGGFVEDEFNSDIFDLSYKGRNAWLVYIMNQIINNRVILVGEILPEDLVYYLNNYLHSKTLEIEIIPRNTLKCDYFSDMVSFSAPSNWNQIESFNNQLKMETKFDILYKTIFDMLSEIKKNGGQMPFIIFEKYDHIYRQRIINFYSEENFMFVQGVGSTFNSVDSLCNFQQLISPFKNSTKQIYIGGVKGKIRINYGPLIRNRYHFKSNAELGPNKEILDLIYYEDNIKYIPAINYDYLYLFNDVGLRDGRKLTTWW